MRSRIATLVPTLALLAVAPSTVTAQDAAQVLEAALDRHAERVANVDNYTVTMDILGNETTTYLVKKDVNGYPVFVSPEQTAADDQWDDPYAAFAKMIDRASYAGQQTIDGKQTHAIEVTDFEGLDFMTPPSGGQGEFVPRRMVVYLDDDEYLARKLVMEGDIDVQGGQPSPMTMTALMTDYRTVEGMPHPYRMAVSVTGLANATGMSGEELAEAKKQLEQLDAQMANMPPEQRKMMEGAMGPQLEKLRQMVETGEMEMSMTVTDLKVNTGPPNGS